MAPMRVRTSFETSDGSSGPSTKGASLFTTPVKRFAGGSSRVALAEVYSASCSAERRLASSACCRHRSNSRSTASASAHATRPALRASPRRTSPPPGSVPRGSFASRLKRHIECSSQAILQSLLTIELSSDGQPESAPTLQTFSASVTSGRLLHTKAPATASMRRRTSRMDQGMQGRWTELIGAPAQAIRPEHGRRYRNRLWPEPCCRQGWCVIPPLYRVFLCNSVRRKSTARAPIPDRAWYRRSPIQRLVGALGDRNSAAGNSYE